MIYTYYTPDQFSKIEIKKGDKIIIEIKRNILDRTIIPDGNITSIIKPNSIYAIDYQGSKHYLKIDKIEHQTKNIIDRKFFIYGTMLSNAIPLLAIILGLSALGLIGIGILIGQVVRIGVSPASITQWTLGLLPIIIIGFGLFFIYRKLKGS